MVSRVKHALLHRAFEFLYGYGALLHEPAGQALFGRAWHGRRIAVLATLVDERRSVVDVGCGDGRLIAAATQRGLSAIGIDPSRRMLRRARVSGALVARARAEALPFATGSADAVLSTYPGPWILDSAAWNEFDRVLKPGGEVVVLLGGTYESGRAAWLRGLALRIVYGPRAGVAKDAIPDLPLEGTGLRVVACWDLDTWGHALTWRGQKAARSESPCAVAGQALPESR
jgi:SAM-dependent methyltransferase